MEIDLKKTARPPENKLLRVVFLDRDGTIIVDPPDEKVDSMEKLEILPGSVEGLRLLVGHGYTLVMVTNQDGLGTSAFPPRRFEEPHTQLLALLAKEEIRFSEVFICPHTPDDHCDCRKPRTGLVREYLARNPVDLAHSFMIGDRESDVQFGKNIGCRTIRLSTDQTSDSEYVARDLLEACRYIVQSDSSR